MHTAASHDQRFRRFVGGDVWRAVDPEGAVGPGPADSVFDDLFHLRIVIGGISLVAGAEVNDLAVAALPGAAGAENLAALEP